MQYIHNKDNVQKARHLRKNMTKEERHLWYDFLRSYPVKFLRQKPFVNYILDFYCAKAKLVIELDGSQHFEESNIIYDKQRTDFLKEYGLEIIRIPNNEITNHFTGVCEYIDCKVKSSLQSLSQLR
ncbi:MAG: endonuclease domain-containing protein [Oscillospiraceae bacterium]|nr:endonuclease domain-containing protein [Oscillospiraceae bacterium]